MMLLKARHSPFNILYASSTEGFIDLLKRQYHIEDAAVLGIVVDPMQRNFPELSNGELGC